MRDTTPPSAFSLIRPRYRLATRKRALGFKWQRSRDAGGIRLYRLYLNGNVVRTVKDKDGPGGQRPAPAARSSACAAASTAGSCGPGTTPATSGTSRAFAGSKSRKSSVLYVDKRGPRGKRQRQQVRQRAEAEVKAKAKAGP